MSDFFNYETYIQISSDKFIISVYSNDNKKVYEEKLIFDDISIQINFEKLDYFLNENIFRIEKKINTFASVFPISNPKFTLVIMLDEPKTNKDYIYHYRDGSNIKYKGTPFNTAGWTTVEVIGQIVEKIGPILATKYSEIN